MVIFHEMLTLLLIGIMALICHSSEGRSLFAEYGNKHTKRHSREGGNPEYISYKMLF